MKSTAAKANADSSPTNNCKLVSFPNCKINLGLRILRKRGDGYHDLDTCFYPLPFYDVLEIITSHGDKIKETIHFQSSGIALDSSADNNSCIKAIHLLRKAFPGQIPALQMHLHKNIPAGAGLGGGSADGAFTLLLLNRLYQLELSAANLKDLALQIGSDCPFFINNTPSIAGGRGEVLTPASVDLSAYHLIIVNPGIHVSTAAAFSRITPSEPELPIKDIISQPVHTWKHTLINDFETPVFQLHPEIKAIRDQLYRAGAAYAAMTGTGSTVYGLFEQAVPEFSFPGHYFTRQFSSLPPGPFTL